MRSPAVVLAVAVLAVTAGCSGLVATTSERTVTPAPVPEPTATDRESAIAPGLGGGGVVDAERLASAHVAALRGRSYTWYERGNATTISDTATRRSAVRRRLVVAGERRYHYRSSTSWRPGNTSEFGTARNRYRREATVTGYRYSTIPATNVSQRFGARFGRIIERYLAVDNATVAETRVDGRRYYQVDGTADEMPLAGTLQNYSVRALIAPSGFVRELTVTYVGEVDGTRHRVRYHFRYAAVGATTVKAPGWVADRWPDNVTTDAQG